MADRTYKRDDDGKFASTGGSTQSSRGKSGKNGSGSKKQPSGGRAAAASAVAGGGVLAGIGGIAANTLLGTRGTAYALRHGASATAMRTVRNSARHFGRTMTRRVTKLGARTAANVLTNKKNIVRTARAVLRSPKLAGIAFKRGAAFAASEALLGRRGSEKLRELGPKVATMRTQRIATNHVKRVMKNRAIKSTLRTIGSSIPLGGGALRYIARSL